MELGGEDLSCKIHRIAALHKKDEDLFSSVSEGEWEEDSMVLILDGHSDIYVL